jgi:hypothetical protein
MLRTVHFDHHARIDAQQIDFHPAPAVERDRQVDIQPESSSRFRQRLQTPIEE